VSEPSDKRTLGDRLLSLKITTLMPPWIWNAMQPFCVSCQWRSRRRKDGERWPIFTRDTLQLLGAKELHCQGGGILLVLPFDVIAWNDCGGCLLHEVAPMWDGARIDRAFNVQDFSEYRNSSFVPLSSTSHSAVDAWRRAEAEGTG
jgi:hypothetical protein